MSGAAAGLSRPAARRPGGAVRSNAALRRHGGVARRAAAGGGDQSTIRTAARPGCGGGRRAGGVSRLNRRLHAGRPRDDASAAPHALFDAFTRLLCVVEALRERLVEAERFQRAICCCRTGTVWWRPTTGWWCFRTELPTSGEAPLRTLFRFDATLGRDGGALVNEHSEDADRKSTRLN